MFNILMVCTGNICRSPMAEGLQISRLPKNWNGLVSVSSAGTHAINGNSAEQNAIVAMEEFEIDLSTHCARLVTKEIVRISDLILVMENSHLNMIKRMVFSGSKKIHMLSKFSMDAKLDDIFDPYGMEVQDYIECANLIFSCIDGVVEYVEKRCIL